MRRIVVDMKTTDAMTMLQWLGLSEDEARRRWREYPVETHVLYTTIPLVPDEGVELCPNSRRYAVRQVAVIARAEAFARRSEELERRKREARDSRARGLADYIPPEEPECEHDCATAGCTPVFCDARA